MRPSKKPATPAARYLRHSMPIVAALVTLGLSAGLVFLEADRQVEHESFHAQETVLAIADNAERRFALSTQVLLALKAFALSSERIEADEFEQFAYNVTVNIPELRSLQLAPGGVVRFAYPLADNQAAIGHEILRDPANKDTAERAIRERSAVAAGPYLLKQGYMGVVVRSPVFRPGDGSFWGFATVVVEFSEFSRRSGLSTSSLELAISGIDAQGASGGFFLGYPSSVRPDTPYADMPLPGGYWRIYAVDEAEGSAFAPRLVHLMLLPALALAVSVFLFTRALQASGLRLERELETRLAREKELKHYEQIVASTEDLVSMVDREHRYRIVNDAYHAVFGREHGKLVGLGVADIIGPELYKAVSKPSLDKAFSGQTVKASAWIDTPTGKRFFTVAYSPVRDPDGSVAFVAIDARDITEIKTLMDRLRDLALTDELTGAATRRAFQERAIAEIPRCRRHGLPLSLCMLDIDDFKLVNDSYGHEAGDAVLRSLAAFCLASQRADDSFCRFGGEEFVFLLPHTDFEEALSFAERIRRGLSTREITCGEKSLRVTVSIGVTSLQAGDITIDDIVRRADAALYLAKRSGKNRVCHN